MLPPSAGSNHSEVSKILFKVQNSKIKDVDTSPYSRISISIFMLRVDNILDKGY